MAKLTKTVVDSLKPGTPDYFVWDDLLPGFGVRVRPSGRKTYIAQYRAGGRTRRVKIGHHGPLTVEEARKEAKAILGDVARGEDPQEDRITRRKTLTVAQLCDTYIETAEAGMIRGKGGRAKKASTLATDCGRIERHIKPLLGTKLVTEVTPADVNRFIRDVASGKTAVVEKTKPRGKAVVEGGTGTAARTTGLLGGILSFAVSEGIIPRNPAAGIKRPAGTRRQRRLTADEFRALGEVLRNAEDALKSAQGIAGIWLLALTGCRLGEIEQLKWSEVDKAGSCFRLEDSKEGQSVRPIGKEAFDVLATVERVPGNPFVLTAVRRGDGPFGGLPGFVERVMKRAELEGVTAHTLRHSFSSVAGDLGFNESTIGAMLGHSAGTVTGRYIHHLDSVLIAAANKVARAIHGMMAGTSGKIFALGA